MKNAQAYTFFRFFRVHSGKCYQDYMTVITSPTSFLWQTTEITNCLSTSKYLFFFFKSLSVFFHIITHSHTHTEAPELACVCPTVNHKSWVKLSAWLNRLYLLAVSTNTGPQEFHRITISMTYCLLLSTHAYSQVHTWKYMNVSEVTHMSLRREPFIFILFTIPAKA